MGTKLSMFYTDHCSFLRKVNKQIVPEEFLRLYNTEISSVSSETLKIKLYCCNDFMLIVDDFKEKYEKDSGKLKLAKYSYQINIINKSDKYFMRFDSKSTKAPVMEPIFHVHSSIYNDIRIPTPEMNFYRLCYMLSIWFNISNLNNILEKYYKKYINKFYEDWLNAF